MHMNTPNYEQFILCGSLSEGFNLPYQDRDSMRVLKQIPLYDCESKMLSDKFCVRLLYEASYTGSVILEVYNGISCVSENIDIGVVNECSVIYKNKCVQI